ncbi:MAG: insulinase family protein [Myxococcota bacterium]
MNRSGTAVISAVVTVGAAISCAAPRIRNDAPGLKERQRPTIDSALPDRIGACRPRSMTLANGMTIIVLRDSSLPLISARLVFRTRRSDVVARALEHATPDIEPRQGLGIDVLLESTPDAIVVRGTSHRKHLDVLLAALAARLRPKRLSPSRLEQAIREFELGREKPPQTAPARARSYDRAEERARARDLEDPTLQNPLVPSEAALIVTGDTRLDEVMAQAVPLFDEARTRPSVTVPRTPTSEPAKRATAHSPSRPPGPELVLLDAPPRSRGHVLAAQLLPPRNHPDYLALVLLNAILVDGRTARLTRAIPGARVRAAIEPGREYSRWFITIDAESEDTPGAIQSLTQELSDVRNAGIDDGTFEEARRRLGQITPSGLETQEARARFISTLFVYDIGLEAYESFMTRLRQLTPNDLRRVARDHLKPDDLRIVVVGSAATLQDPLRRLDYGPVRIETEARIEGHQEHQQ